MMDKFGAVATMVERLTGPDAAVWNERYAQLALREDPYRERVPRGVVFAVKHRSELQVRELLPHLKEKGVIIDPRIIAATNRILAEADADVTTNFVIERMAESEMAFVEFIPSHFGVHVDWKRASFGADGEVAYSDIEEAATKYGFHRTNLIYGLYLRLAYFEAHKYNEGTLIYVGCMPQIYEDGKPPVIPGLVYDRHLGWSITAHEVGVGYKLKMDHGHGQGEHFGHTFAFPMPSK